MTNKSFYCVFISVLMAFVWVVCGGSDVQYSVLCQLYLHEFNFVSTLFVMVSSVETCINVFTCFQMCIKINDW